MDALLLSDAKGGEDLLQDVVVGGGAGEGVERAEGVVEVDGQQLVRELGGDGFFCGGKGGEGGFQGLLLAEVGEERGFFAGGSLANVGENGGAELVDAGAG